MFTWLKKLTQKSRLFNKDAIQCKTLRLLTCQIHGSHYYNCLKLVEAEKIHKGDCLRLTREPNNEYDESAIEIHHQGEKLGYVPKNNNTVIATLMDQQCHISAVVQRVEPEAWEPVTIRIEWLSDNHNSSR